MRAERVTIDGGEHTVFRGGAGDALLLVHGSWGNVAMYWSRVWRRLEERFSVVAPELPGFAGPGPRPASVEGYARWLERLLDTLGVETADLVGSSFGAAVVWSLAALAPERCRELVLVNGLPVPETPAVLRRMAERATLRRLVERVLRRVAFSPDTLRRGFADLAGAPPEVRSQVLDPRPEKIELLIDVLLAGAPRAHRPRVAPLIVWGEEDRLRGHRVEVAERLHRALAGSRLVSIPQAGHLPQVEQPERFLDALRPLFAPLAE